MSTPNSKRSRFSTFAWIFLAYMIAVVMFGAWVRITGSGAGCGDHWPTCRGEIVPLAPSIATIIEYTHRVTSGLVGILALALLVWAYKRYSTRHRVFRAAAATMVFTVFEALIGAALVLGKLVAHDDSVARAVVQALHLVNTLSLIGAATLTAWWSTGAPAPRLRSKGPLKWLLGLGMVGLVVTSIMGAITALGDTLFPVTPTMGPGLFARVNDELSAANHFLVRLRIVHPVVAVLVAVFVVALTTIVRTSDVPESARRAALVLLATVVVQVVVGVANIWLGAPGWMQLVHLCLAQLVWVAMLVMANEALSRAPATS